MKNIHLILVNKVAASLYYCSNTRDFFTTRQTPDDLLYEMYITSNEEIKEGDWALQFNDIGTEPKIVFNVKYQVPPECVVKKIVLTTDEYLINDDAQAIDDEFLEWICKNPSCEAVEVKSNYRVKSGTIQEHNEGKAGYEYYDYKIIIPKEEPKYPIGGYAPGYYGCTCVTCKTEFMGDKRAYQCEPCATKIDDFFTSFPSKQETLEEEFKFKNRQMGAAGFVGNKIMENMISKFKQETLEEVAHEMLVDYGIKSIGQSIGVFTVKKLMVNMAKWQQERMYSEEEVIKIVEKSRETGLTAEYLLLTEQFKKK